MVGSQQRLFIFEVMYFDSSIVVGRVSGPSGQYSKAFRTSAHQFKPPKSEREETIDELHEDYMVTECDHTHSKGLGHLYDKGWRKK